MTGRPFATIIPEGSDAERALDLVVDDPDLCQYHRSFITVQRKTRPGVSGSDVSESERHVTPKEIWTGHYMLSLTNLCQNPTTIGWHIGRGSSKNPATDRGVDILLIRPRKKTEGVATVHARIQFNPLSGALMLVGVEDLRPIQYKVHDSSHPVLLSQEQKHVLYQKINNFRLGNLNYSFVYEEMKREEYAEFVAYRNKIFENLGHKFPHPAILAIPRQKDIKRGPVITHGTLGFGKFGWVYSGVNARTGEPLAIKEHRVKNLHEQRVIDNEIHVGMANCVGILRTKLEWCEHQNQKPCGKIPESIFTASPLAIRDFCHHGWNDTPLPEILEFYRGPLIGLSFLHRYTCMHRDVHGGNLFIISLNPPKAVLGDFGKAKEGLLADNPHLGPGHTVAPEVDGKSNYNEKIDVWSLGFSLFGSICYERQKENLVQGEHVTKKWHDGAMECLHDFSKKGRLQTHVTELLRYMLAWNPKARISAEKALEHPCFGRNFNHPLPSPPSKITRIQPTSNDSTSSSKATAGSSSSQGPTGASMPEYHLDKRRRQTAEQRNPPLLRRR
ncbi:MAG: hypothetical protein Q9167_006610 [Letrouitia subvulpina]